MPDFRAINDCQTAYLKKSFAMSGVVSTYKEFGYATKTT